MMNWNDYLQMFIGLFAIISPVSMVPMFLSFTANIAPRRQAVARLTALSVSVILTGSVLIGETILNLFSISVDSFRVAGGILLMTIAFSMLEARSGRIKHTPEEDEEALESDSVAIVPLAIPLLAGPGAISTVILFRNQFTGFSNIIGLIIICQIMAIFCWLVFHHAEALGKRMSTTSMNVTSRVMGLILAAMAVEFITAGIRGLLPGLA